MNYRKYLNSAALKADPLCGISTYKDTLNLATGSCTRYIKKIVLDGSESWRLYSSGSNYVYFDISVGQSAIENINLSSHFQATRISASNYDEGFGVQYRQNGEYTSLLIRYSNLSTSTTSIKNFLTEQYTAGKPVTIWYVLETATTETISLPSGLSGTLEGSLTQSGTPTPSAPIYPTAVTGEGWYSINNYIRDTSWTSDSVYERESGAWT